jgi:CheY-like chemotaxis protein
VLLVDDSATNRQLARRLLEKRHHQVTAVENGLEAVREFEKDAYDIILMDVQMPQMDGLEATALIREREALVGGHIPIVALTAHAMKGDRDRCLEAGMDAYVSKPFQADELFATVEQLVSYASAGGLSRPAATGAVPGAAPAGPSIDWDEAVARLGGSPELLGEVAAIFLDCYQDLRNELDAALDGGDCATAGKRAHRLKGDLAAIGATAASDAAKELEVTAKAGDLEAARAAHVRFAAEMAKTEPDIVTLAAGIRP